MKRKREDGKKEWMTESCSKGTWDLNPMIQMIRTWRCNAISMTQNLSPLKRMANQMDKKKVKILANLAYALCEN